MPPGLSRRSQRRERAFRMLCTRADARRSVLSRALPLHVRACVRVVSSFFACHSGRPARHKHPVIHYCRTTRWQRVPHKRAGEAMRPLCAPHPPEPLGSSAQTRAFVDLAMRTTPSGAHTGTPLCTDARNASQPKCIPPPLGVGPHPVISASSLSLRLARRRLYAARRRVHRLRGHLLLPRTPLP